MPNHSHITIVGHLGRDPELKVTPKGVAVCKFSVAVNTGYGDNKTTTWWNITLFNKQAETAAKGLSKGKVVLVEGEPQVRSYTKTDGTKGTSPEITASRFVFLSERDEKPSARPLSHVDEQSRAGGDAATDDIPF
jgi:single-strand DNA-binding protein